MKISNLFGASGLLASLSGFVWMVIKPDVIYNIVPIFSNEEIIGDAVVLTNAPPFYALVLIGLGVVLALFGAILPNKNIIME